MPPAEPPLLSGRYRVGECIGEGGMARVYRAEDVALGRTVAIKRMRGSIDDDPARVRSEMRLLAGLSHPSLVTLLDAHLGDETPGGDGDFLVMEYVDGPTLAQCLSGGPLPAATAAAVTVDLADALHTVHSAGIVHRDIKPSNILLSPSPLPMRQFRAKLADFGIAYLHDSARITSPGLVLGTAAYLAPEQVRGDAPTPAVDVFSLGLVIIEALTGLRAYRRGTGAEALVARLAAAPAIPPDLDDGWRELLIAMTALDPRDRPTALDVAVAASALTSTGMMIAMPPAAPAPSPEPSGDIAREPVTPVWDLDTSALPTTLPTAAPLVSGPASASPTATITPTRRAARLGRTRRSRRATALWGAAAVATLLVAGVVSALSGAFGTAGSVTPVVSEPTPARILPAPAPTEEIAEDGGTSPATVLDSVPASDTGVGLDDGQVAEPQTSPTPAASSGPIGTATTPAPSAPDPSAPSPAPGGDDGAVGGATPTPAPPAPTPAPSDPASDEGSSGPGGGGGPGNGNGNGPPDGVSPPPFDRGSSSSS
ncbi:serine/threonine-protein kinase [Microbacterium invictum]|uniref:Serine/threonine-protein kinase n=1 Tax=Microbacterium invictum TaxID=515415 RepID=A0ABZ0VF83_9MICO|nr:serine/threonine-protein kinase [Microbacterium invictum]WQB71507.1 serine/threonine-protein kinase [Microbacterium invictum]